MTFYEAAVQVLLKAGHPLHAREIAEIAIKENLLSHVGKEPEVTMAARLAAMVRRSHDGRLVAVEPDTFGLTDWNLVTQPEALEQSGQPEVHDETEPPLRERERHPKVDASNVRVSGRGDRRRKHEEERKKKKRLPPAAELVFDLLGKVGKPLPLFDLAAAVREKELVGDDLGREGLEAMLTAENQRRDEEGRRPIFAFHDEGLVGLHAGAAPATEPQDYPALIAQALARMAEERKAPAPVAAAKAAGTVERAAEEQRQRAIRLLRKRIGELDTSAFESLVLVMLAEMGYRDVKVAKRHKEGALFLARRRMGLTEVRFAIRALKGGREVRREEIAELRKDMGSHAAQMGVVVSPADPTREAKNEASQASAPLVTLLCADALAEQLAEKGVGVAVRTVQYVDFDEAALRAALRRGPALAEGEAEPAAKKASDATAEERRERRKKEREEWRERREKAREERRRKRLEDEAAAAAAQPAGAEAGAAEAVAVGEAVATEPAEAAVGAPTVEEKKGAEGAEAEAAGETKADEAGAAHEAGEIGSTTRAGGETGAESREGGEPRASEAAPAPEHAEDGGAVEVHVDFDEAKSDDATGAPERRSSASGDDS